MPGRKLLQLVHYGKKIMMHQIASNTCHRRIIWCTGTRSTKKQQTECNKKNPFFAADTDCVNYKFITVGDAFRHFPFAATSKYLFRRMGRGFATLMPVLMYNTVLFGLYQRQGARASYLRKTEWAVLLKKCTRACPRLIDPCQAKYYLGVLLTSS